MHLSYEMINIFQARVAFIPAIDFKLIFTSGKHLVSQLNIGKSLINKQPAGM